MKINELLVESQQLDEGPFGQAVGKAVGGLAKGVGAVAGGVAGMGRAFKKGYQSGKATVAGDPDPNETPAGAEPAAPQAAPAQGAAPAAQGAAPAATEPGGGAGVQPAAKDVNAAGPKGTAPAQNLKGAAKTAADKTAAATQDQNANQAGQTMYAQVKANIDKLDKKGKQRILQLLQKSVQQAPAKTPAGAAPAAGAPTSIAAPEAPAAEPAAQAPAPAAQAPAAPAAGQPDELGRVEPTVAPEPAPAGQPAPKRTGGKVKGQVSNTPNAVRKREARKGKQQPQGQSQAEIDADRNRIMGNFTDSVERHKKRMVAEALQRGEMSFFRK